MFKSATIKLTLFYTLAISVVCIVFSISIYGLSSSRIEREAERQFRIVQQFNSDEDSSFRNPSPENPVRPINVELRQQIREQIENDRDRLLINILAIDFLIISFGAIASYFFARKTLQPIYVSMEKQTRFSADASHELRTPLAVMKAEIDVVLAQKLKNSELRDVLESNLEEVDRLQVLADQLLALTSIESKEYGFEKVNFSRHLEEFVARFESKSKVEIEQAIENNIYVTCNPSLMDHYLQIILENAVKYAKQESPKIKVSLEKDKIANCVLTIRDEGIGISQSDIDKVFDRFYRSNNAKETGKSGHGLGLSLASQIAKKHGSKIRVDSQPGEYSSFSLSLKCS